MASVAKACLRCERSGEHHENQPRQLWHDLPGAPETSIIWNELVYPWPLLFDMRKCRRASWASATAACFRWPRRAPLASAAPVRHAQAPASITSISHYCLSHFGLRRVSLALAGESSPATVRPTELDEHRWQQPPAVSALWTKPSLASASVSSATLIRHVETSGQHHEHQPPLFEPLCFKDGHHWHQLANLCPAPLRHTEIPVSIMSNSRGCFGPLSGASTRGEHHWHELVYPSSLRKLRRASLASAGASMATHA